MTWRQMEPSFSSISLSARRQAKGPWLAVGPAAAGAVSAMPLHEARGGTARTARESDCQQGQRAGSGRCHHASNGGGGESGGDGRGDGVAVAACRLPTGTNLAHLRNQAHACCVAGGVRVSRARAINNG